MSLKRFSHRINPSSTLQVDEPPLNRVVPHGDRKDWVLVRVVDPRLENSTPAEHPWRLVRGSWALGSIILSMIDLTAALVWLEAHPKLALTQAGSILTDQPLASAPLGELAPSDTQCHGCHAWLTSPVLESNRISCPSCKRVDAYCDTCYLELLLHRMDVVMRTGPRPNAPAPTRPGKLTH